MGRHRNPHHGQAAGEGHLRDSAQTARPPGVRDPEFRGPISPTSPSSRRWPPDLVRIPPASRGRQQPCNPGPSQLGPLQGDLCRKLFQVIVDVDLKELPPFRRRHFSEHAVRPPIYSRSCIPGSIQDSEQLSLLEDEVELRAVGNLETLWVSQPGRLLWNQSTGTRRNTVRETT